ncbi:MAG: formylglycine-generating enzyme family protein [Tannerella sp.]|jgi:formylglycine-generating enzyme required for sulfatase activity|nr:formylglycine-generating enzyme family protein [Tannerella sp.]
MKKILFVLLLSAFYINAVCQKIDMVKVSGGTFMMGCMEGDTSCHPYEKPVHEVVVSDFYIGRYEVTQAQWEAVMGSNPSYFKGKDLPVERVSWNDVQEFIRRLNEATGMNYRLPTEAEWEYAAREGKRGSKTLFSGSSNATDAGWIFENSDGKTHPVGAKKPNKLGICDMTGNVWEWCSDWTGNYTDSIQSNPQGSREGTSRVLRGGGWNCTATYSRITYRSYHWPASAYNYLGFRLAKSKTD